MRRQFGRQENGCRPVRTTDNTDSGGFLHVESKCKRPDECRINSNLRRGAQHQGLWIGQQGAKIGQRPDAQKDQRGQNFVPHPEIEK